MIAAWPRRRQKKLPCSCGILIAIAEAAASRHHRACPKLQPCAATRIVRLEATASYRIMLPDKNSNSWRRGGLAAPPIVSRQPWPHRRREAAARIEIYREASALVVRHCRHLGEACRNALSTRASCSRHRSRLSAAARRYHPRRRQRVAAHRRACGHRRA